MVLSDLKVKVHEIAGERGRGRDMEERGNKF